jgi:antitoxin FitA
VNSSHLNSIALTEAKGLIGTHDQSRFLDFYVLRKWHIFYADIFIVIAHSVRTKRIFHFPFPITLLNLRGLGPCPWRYIQNVHMRYTFKPAPGKGLVCRNNENNTDCGEIERAIAIAHSVRIKSIPLAIALLNLRVLIFLSLAIISETLILLLVKSQNLIVCCSVTTEFQEFRALSSISTKISTEYIDHMEGLMVSLTIRNLDEALKSRLHVRAAQHGRSMEEEAHDILRTALAVEHPAPHNLAEAIHQRFAAWGGIDLLPMSRDVMHEPPVSEK